MATISIEIPNDKVELLKTVLRYPEQVEVNGELVDNPQTPQDFFKEWVAAKVRREVQAYEINLARQNAQLTDTTDIQ